MRQAQRMASLIGKAGEHAVAAQLLVRGVEVYFPASDYGVDLIAGNGCRIQVKSSHLAITDKMLAHRGEGTYTFPLRRQKRVAVSDTKVKMISLPPMSEVCDVVACWGIDQSRFWIVPSKIADNATLLCLGREAPRRFVGNIEDVREMVKLGYKHHEIAKKYDVCREVISMLLNRDGFESQGPSATTLARQCENAWEHIINFERAAPIVEVEREQSESS